ncbi:MAG: response regulator [Negativicutes bacterium]|jgi:two-component SAPR family response regulator
MRVILVDDESMLLKDLARKLGENAEVDIVEQFTRPLEAYKWFESGNTVDAAFLDISMPEMNGLTLAENIISLAPATQIVFVTAYNEYAIKAFELNAIDYLLKPVNRERLAKTVLRLRAEQITTIVEPPKPIAEAPISISFFNRFDLRMSGQPVKWRSKKAEEVFAYLAYNLEKYVHKEQLCELLWPDFDGETALMNLQTSAYRARKAVAVAGDNIKIFYSNDCYRMTREHWDSDLDAFEQIMHKARSGITAADKAELKKIHGEGFCSENGWLWAYEIAANLEERYYMVADE